MIWLSAFTALHLAVLAGIVAAGGPTWFAIFIPLPLIGFVVGYLSIGIASLRTDAHPQLVGLLLLAPGVIVVVMLIQMFAGWTSEFQAFVISAGEAMAHLAIGATIKTDSDPNHRNHSSHGDREVAAHD